MQEHSPLPLGTFTQGILPTLSLEGWPATMQPWAACLRPVGLDTLLPGRLNGIVLQGDHRRVNSARVRRCTPAVRPTRQRSF